MKLQWQKSDLTDQDWVSKMSLLNLCKTWMQYITYYPWYKLLNKYLRIRLRQFFSMQLKMWNVTFNHRSLFFLRHNTVWKTTSYRTENWSLSRLWMRNNNSYSEWKDKTPFIIAQVYESFSAWEHLHPETIKWCSQLSPWLHHYKAILPLLLCSHWTKNQQLWVGAPAWETRL